MSAGRRLLALADTLPVLLLAVIAGAGSFTHIRDTARRGPPAPPDLLHPPQRLAAGVMFRRQCSGRKDSGGA